MQTIENLLVTAVDPIEIIVPLDGWNTKAEGKVTPELALAYQLELQAAHDLAAKDSRIQLVTYNKPLGQRVIINRAAVVAKGEYIFKLDAHCLMEQCWDVELKKACADDTWLTTRMHSLDIAYNKGTRNLDFCKIGPDMGLGWWQEYAERTTDIVAETMAFFGTTWFLRKELWDKLGGYDDTLAPWGESGYEFSVKVWLRGYRMLVHRGVPCWHLYRRRFPYRMTGGPRQKTKRILRHRYLNNLDPAQIHPIEWLIGKFWPIPGWERSLLTDAERIRWKPKS